MPIHMQPPRNPSPIVENADASNDEDRQKGRLRCEMLKCDLGRVCDLSASGMRVLRRGLRGVKKDQETVISLRHATGTFNVKVRVAWIKNEGFLRHEIGLEFVDLTDEMADELVAIARVAAERLTVASHD